MQTIKALVGHKDGDTTWEEEWTNSPDGDPQKVAEGIIQNFNATLRPYEKPRRLVRVLSAGKSIEHHWEKTSLVTEMGKRNEGSFDRMMCSRCGVTGKRYELGCCGVTRDRKYKADKYKDCSWKH